MKMNRKISENSITRGAQKNSFKFKTSSPLLNIFKRDWQIKRAKKKVRHASNETVKKCSRNEEKQTTHKQAKISRNQKA